MNPHIKTAIWMICWFIICLSLAVACAGPGQKSTAAPKLERYEDKAIGFSIAYNAQELTKDLMLSGNFVFRREAANGLPSVGIIAGPYPPRTSLKDTTELISNDLPDKIPGCIVHRINNQQLFKLADGTDANYFEIDWTIDGRACIGAFVAAKRDDRLVVFGAADRKQAPMQNLTAMVKSLSFDVEVDEAALRAIGFGKNGRFVRTDSPAFTLDYPKAFRNRPLLPYQIFRAGIPQGSPAISIGFTPLRPGEQKTQQMKALAERYTDSLSSVGSDIKIISQNPIDNYPGFDAYQIRIAWRYRGQTTLTTIVHFIAKMNWAIRLAGHTVYNPDELLEIFKTIDLNPG